MSKKSKKSKKPKEKTQEQIDQEGQAVQQALFAVADENFPVPESNQFFGTRTPKDLVNRLVASTTGICFNPYFSPNDKADLIKIAQQDAILVGEYLFGRK